MVRVNCRIGDEGWAWWFVGFAECKCVLMVLARDGVATVYMAEERDEHGLMELWNGEVKKAKQGVNY